MNIDSVRAFNDFSAMTIPQLTALATIVDYAGDFAFNMAHNRNNPSDVRGNARVAYKALNDLHSRIGQEVHRRTGEARNMKLIDR